MTDRPNYIYEPDSESDMEYPVSDWTICPDCGTPLIEKWEKMGNETFLTQVAECPGCGYMETTTT